MGKDFVTIHTRRPPNFFGFCSLHHVKQKRKEMQRTGIFLGVSFSIPKARAEKQRKGNKGDSTKRSARIKKYRNIQRGEYSPHILTDREEGDIVIKLLGRA
jgi:hypothetical protein